MEKINTGNNGTSYLVNQCSRANYQMNRKESFWFSANNVVMFKNINAKKVKCGTIIQTGDERWSQS